MVTRKDLLKYKALMVKSNYIIEASYKLNLQEQRLIYILTTKINKDDIEFKPCRFTQNEISKILTKHKINFSELSGYIDSLRNKELVIVKEESILKTKWLSSAEYFENGDIELCFDNKLKPYLLQLKNRFTKLNLDNVISFNSNYSCRIYELLKQYEKVGERTVSIDVLRTMFCIEPDEYKRYNDFKRKVILQAQKEINASNGDWDFEFDEIKSGRKVTSIRFIIHKKSDEIAVDAVEPTELERIKAILFDENITGLEAKKLLDAAKGNIKIIEEKYSIARKTSNIKNIVGWVIGAIKEDYQKPKSKVSNGSFNDYEQREYDYEDLEKRLLGWKES